MPEPSVHVFDSAEALLGQSGWAPWPPPSDMFLSWPWFQLLAQSGFAVPMPTAWLCARDGLGGQLALPLIGTAQGLQGLSNYYSSLFGAVGDAGCASDALWSALARRLRALPGAGVVQLQPLAQDAAFTVGLARGLRANGYWVDSFFCFGNWYLPVQGRTAAEHFADRPSALRHTVERARRRLQRAGPPELEIVTGPAPELERAIADFEEVYAASWKAAEPSPVFMPGLIRMAAGLGWLRLGVLRLEGRPIAAQVWLVCAGKANIYKLAYAEGFQRFSPGSVLTAAMMAHAIDVDRVQEIDYLTGDDVYKRDWMARRRERVGLVAFDPLRPAGLLAALRHRAGRWRKRWRRPGP